MSFEAPLMPPSITDPITRSALIAANAQINEWAPDDVISGYSVHQLQQLRRIARLMRRLPWHDSQMRADELMRLTWQLLTDRCAIRTLT